MNWFKKIPYIWKYKKNVTNTESDTAISTATDTCPNALDRKTVKEKLDTLDDNTYNTFSDFQKFILDTHLVYIEYSIKNMVKHLKNDYEKYGCNLLNIIDNLIIKVADKNENMYFGNDFFDQDGNLKQKLIGAKFKYVYGFYNIDNIPDFLIPSIKSPGSSDKIYCDITIYKNRENINTFTFTLLEEYVDKHNKYIKFKIQYKNIKNEMVEDEFELKINLSELIKEDYPGNSIYGHLFEKIEEDRTPQTELTGGKKSRKQRRRRHCKSRKHRKSRRYNKR